MSSVFDEDTRVRPVEGGYAADVSPRWNVLGNPNGGYTISLVARAMMAASGRPHPLSVTAHYVTPPPNGEVQIVPEVIRAGRRFATVRASMRSGAKAHLEVIGAFGDLDSFEGASRMTAAMPDIPPPEECILSPQRKIEQLRLQQRYELRFDPATQFVQKLTNPDFVDDPEVDLVARGWIRFSDGSDPSTLSLLALSDAFPPTPLGGPDVGWVPTIELTTHIRRQPSPGWILGSFRTRVLTGGLHEADGELWDSSGNLVAMSRQLALVLPPRP